MKLSRILRRRNIDTCFLLERPAQWNILSQLRWLTLEKFFMSLRLNKKVLTLGYTSNYPITGMFTLLGVTTPVLIRGSMNN